MTSAASRETYRLAEGPVWDAARRRLLWVDILGGAVLEGTLHGDGIVVTRRHRFDGTVGAVTVAEDGTLLVAAQEHLVVLRPDGTRADGPRIVPAGERRRLNDGSTDPAGRFLVGTLSLAGPSEREVLVRLETDGTVTELDGDLTLSNGLAWSTDGSRMFSVDTERRVVYLRDYHPATGAVGERHVHLRVDEHYPDGIAVDADDHLWVAVWGAGEVRRFAPDGSLVHRIRVPAPHTSCVAFAGDDLRTLVITSATAELSESSCAPSPTRDACSPSGSTSPACPCPCGRAPPPADPPKSWRSTVLLMRIGAPGAEYVLGPR